MTEEKLKSSRTAFKFRSGNSDENVLLESTIMMSQNEISKVINQVIYGPVSEQQLPSSVASPSVSPTVDNNSSSAQQASDVNHNPPPLINNNTANVDINSTLCTLLQQNQFLMNRLLERDSIPVRNDSPFPTNPDGFYVMPDFHNTVPTFSGTESRTQARDWLHSVHSVAQLHHWPDAFKLEIVRTKLVAAASNWLCGRNFTTWSAFEVQFKSTFIGQAVSLVDCMKSLLSRIQNKSETPVEYFHDKARLCREIELPFTETRQQIIEGLHCRELCFYLLARDHKDENSLLSDIVSFTNMKTARFAHFKSDPQTVSISARSFTSPKLQNNKTTSQTSKQPPPSNSSMPVTRCFNCSSFGHFASSCTKPKREPGSCFRCGSTLHKLRDCQSTTSANKEALVLQSPSDNVNSAYTINLILKFPNDKIVDVLAIVDTGSPVSLIKQKIVPSWSPPLSSPIVSGLVGINGSELIVLDQMFIDIFSPDDDCPINVKVNIVPDSTIKCDLLLGRNFLSHPRVVLTINSGSFEIDFKRSDIVPFDEILSIDSGQDSKVSGINLNIEESLPSNVKSEIEDIVTHSYLDNDSTLQSKIIEPPELVIELKDSSVFHFNPRRLSYFEKDKLQIILDDLIEKKIIKPSSSEYSSPIVLVKKKNGELRLCVDYRELNKRMVKDRYPLPLIDDHLDSLRGMRYYTCIDLKDGFHHVKVAEHCQKYTSFITPLGQFVYLRMPFGICNGPSKFQRFINNIFQDLIRAKRIIVYFDDIVIATKTIDEHLSILSEALTLMRAHQLQIRFDKSQFLKVKIIYLGYQVSEDGISPNPKNVSVIRDYPVPSNPKALHSFLGLASYFRRFIPNFSTIAKPLYELIRKDVPFCFGEDKLCAFEQIKEKLIERPILCLYNPVAETQLHCDASSLGFGSILLQKQSDGKLHPIFYYSQRTTDIESKYHSYELEMLAIINSIKRFHVYLLGIKFKIITDCNSITLTLKKKDINPRIARWALFLQNYNYEIEHRSSSQMHHVDALSRNHILVLEGCTFNQTLSIKQNTDSEIKKIAETLEKSEHPLYELRNGLVYRKNHDRLLFFVPSEMRDHVIRANHDDMGHIGVDRTVELIKRVYWFPKLTDSVKKYIENCLKCIIFSPSEGKREGFLKLIEKGNKPFDTIHVDHYGPLGMTKGKFKHIFVIVDAFSKFITLYPVRSVKTKEVCSKLNEYFSYYSRPLRIISDRGTCYTSEMFKDFCKSHDIQHVLIAAGSPQANGQVERYNRTIKAMLSKFLHEKGQNWNIFLGKVQFCINNTYNRSIKNSPSKILFGINQHGETNDFLRLILEADSNHDIRNRDLSVIRSAAQENIYDAQLKNKLYFDQSRKPPKTYKIGDYIMIKNVDTTPGVSKKHIPKFKGPYEIKAVLPNDRYVIKDIDGFQVTQTPLNSVYESKHIKPWIKPSVS